MLLENRAGCLSENQTRTPGTEKGFWATEIEVYPFEEPATSLNEFGEMNKGLARSDPDLWSPLNSVKDVIKANEVVVTRWNYAFP